MLRINTGDDFLIIISIKFSEHEFHIVDLGMSLGFVK